MIIINKLLKSLKNTILNYSFELLMFQRQLKQLIFETYDKNHD